MKIILEGKEAVEYLEFKYNRNDKPEVKKEAAPVEVDIEELQQRHLATSERVKTAFNHVAKVEQPVAPVVRNTRRTTWTLEMDSIIVATGGHEPKGVYRNSFKHLKDKLPKTLTDAAIRSRLAYLGYSSIKGYINAK